MKWTNEAYKTLILLRDNKQLSNSVIAKKMGRTTTSVNKACSKLIKEDWLVSRKEEQYLEAVKPKEAWSEEEEQAIFQLSNEGHNIKRIAFRLNKTIESVKNKISDMSKEINPL